MKIEINGKNIVIAFATTFIISCIFPLLGVPLFIILWLYLIAYFLDLIIKKLKS